MRGHYVIYLTLYAVLMATLMRGHYVKLFLHSPLATFINLHSLKIMNLALLGLLPD